MPKLGCMRNSINAQVAIEKIDLSFEFFQLELLKYQKVFELVLSETEYYY